MIFNIVSITAHIVQDGASNSRHVQKSSRHVKNIILSIFENLTLTGDFDLQGHPMLRSGSRVPTVTFQTKKDHPPNMYHYRGINPQRVLHLAINLFADASSSN